MDWKLICCPTPSCTDGMIPAAGCDETSLRLSITVTAGDDGRIDAQRLGLRRRQDSTAAAADRTKTEAEEQRTPFHRRLRGEVPMTKRAPRGNWDLNGCGPGAITVRLTIARGRARCRLRVENRIPRRTRSSAGMPGPVSATASSTLSRAGSSAVGTRCGGRPRP